MDTEQIKTALIILRFGKAASEIAVQINGNVVYSRQLPIDTRTMDAAVVEHFQCKLNLLIGEKTAEAIRKTVGSAFPEDAELAMQVRGRDLDLQSPRTVTVTEAEISRAISKAVEILINAIRSVIGRVSVEAQTALTEFGAIKLRGEGANLRGFDKQLLFATGLPVIIV